jgi:hypothetical protein
MGMFALLALFGWLVWTFVLHRRVEAARAMNVGVVRTLIDAGRKDSSDLRFIRLS